MKTTDLAERVAAIAAQARDRAVSDRERNRSDYPEFVAWLEQWRDMGRLTYVDQPREWGKTCAQRAQDEGGLGVCVVASSTQRKAVSMKKQRGVTVVEMLAGVVGTSIVIAAVIGWIWNIVKLVSVGFDNPITGWFVARAIGIFVMPQGAVLGYL